MLLLLTNSKNSKIARIKIFINLTAYYIYMLSVAKRERDFMNNSIS